MRSQWSITSDYELHAKIKKLSELTRIPVSRLIDEAIEDLLEKHNFEEKVNQEKMKSKK